jgi:hypothetical protein
MLQFLIPKGNTNNLEFRNLPNQLTLVKKINKIIISL